jgi:hypothetical protein
MWGYYTTFLYCQPLDRILIWYIITTMNERPIFVLKIRCAGNVPSKYDPNKLFYDFGLDGKLRIWKDVNHTQPVRFTLGSTCLEIVR